MTAWAVPDARPRYSRSGRHHSGERSARANTSGVSASPVPAENVAAAVNAPHRIGRPIPRNPPRNMLVRIERSLKRRGMCRDQSPAYEPYDVTVESTRIIERIHVGQNVVRAYSWVPW